MRRRFAPAESRQKHGQIVQAGEDMRVYLARAMEGSLIGFIVSGVFISTLWYPSLWIMMALVVALRNISEVERRRVATGCCPFQISDGCPLTEAWWADD